MQNDNITSEVRKYIADKLASGESIVVEWLTHEIISNRPLIDGEDCDFYRVCAHEHIGRVVKRSVGKYDASPKTDGQLVLDGFSYLQTGYSVVRNDQRLLVPTDQLSDDELTSRAVEYDAMAKGCKDHAKEIRHYILHRDQAAA